ncbi:MAG: hypothetical protein A3E82_06595 [Gammaproteobacteria bacterium RIFCSPHIGHO2_12_FULL_38_11]|nr:MAG: hypothetical protein A3E82_06595 [Gammaproteobacteria bacterium RIFCSPHIGHO2_12_FULL_38_11]
MIIVNIHEAKTNLSKLLQEVMHGQEVIIAKAGVPIAVIKPIEAKKPKRIFGSMKGEIWVSDNFDDPLSDEDLDLWYNGDIFPKEK